MTIIFLIILSFISACLYRMGGCSPEDLQKEWGWVPKLIRNFPKKRDVGCNLITLFAVSLVIPPLVGWWNLMYLLAFGLMWASLSTYWDELFGFDNHWFHGFAIGMSILPIFFDIRVLAYAVPLAVFMGLWSKLLGNATWEELGRGFFMPATIFGLSILLI